MSYNLPNAKIWKTAQEINEKTIHVANQLNQKFENEIDADIIIIGILNGGYIFLSDLTKHLKFKFRVDFIAASSYTENARTGGFDIRSTLKYSIKGCIVIVVDEILDTGITLYKIGEYFAKMEPKSIHFAVLILDNTTIYKQILDRAVYGFLKEPIYVYGYGMDYKEYYRALPDIWYVGIEKDN